MKRAENQPTSELVLYAGLFCKLWSVADRGTVLPQHSHEFPHLSLIVQGKVHVWRGDDHLGVFAAPAAIRIPAHTFHKFETITNNVVIACIHNADHAEADGEPPIAEHHNLVLED
jgi:hypothetical protein